MTVPSAALGGDRKRRCNAAAHRNQAEEPEEAVQPGCPDVLTKHPRIGGQECARQRPEKPELQPIGGEPGQEATVAQQCGRTCRRADEVVQLQGPPMNTRRPIQEHHPVHHVVLQQRRVQERERKQDGSNEGHRLCTADPDAGRWELVQRKLSPRSVLDRLCAGPGERSKENAIR